MLEPLRARTVEPLRARTALILFGVLGGFLLAYLVWLVVRGPQALQLGVTNGWVGTAFRLAAGVVCLIFGLRQRRGSYVPLVFGVALIFTAIGNTILTLDSLHGPPPPPPTPADIFGLSFIALCLAGIGLMAREDRQRLSPRELLDGGIAALGAASVCAAFALARIPRLPEESTLGSASQLAFAIGFVVLVLLVVSAATVAAGRSRVAWVELTVAFALLALGSGLGAALGMTIAVRTLTEIQWPAATLLIAAAMWADPGEPDPLAVHRGVAVWIPALACCAAIAVLFAATLTRVDHTATALAASALLLVMVRGYSELRHEIGTRERTEKSLRVSEAGYRRVADEQAALRRVAVLVAAGAPPSTVFAAVADEIGRLLAVEGAFVVRYESDDTVTILAGRTTSDRPLPIGLRTPITAPSLGSVVRETGRPARIDHYADHPVALQYGVRSSAAAPITVQGRLWGYIGVTSTREEPPPGTEVRLAAFTEIAATAIANSQAREELRTIADEQAALRRVATLVAGAALPADVFAAVAEEVGRLLAVDAAAVRRYLADDTAEILAQWSRRGEFIPVGLRAQPVRGTVTATVRETRRPARVDRYTEDAAGGAAREIGIRSAVGVPITVEGELWGLIAVVSTGEEPPPPGTEERLAGFTELVAIAIANAQARQELRTIADEQAALGRVATLVARGEAPAVVFAAVAEEVGHLLNTDDALVVRFEPDESVTIVASWTGTGEPLPVGDRRHVEPGDGLTPLVRETGLPARIDSQTAYYSELGVESAVAAPITVEGRIWGVVGVALRGSVPAPPDTEERLAAFTGLVATAIANAESRAQLMASRERIVAAADGARRRIERDLHDGAQQQLVSLALRLREAQAAMPPDLAAQLDTFAAGLNGALEELQELARGIHPPILAAGGLGPALKLLARRSAVPVEVALRTADRLPEPVEIAAYYFISEALTNATKHAHATAITVTIEADANDHVLRIAVRDDGVGGADFTHGTGLVGLKDRVEALSGRILLDSTKGAGTRLSAELPIPATKDSVTSS